MSKAVYLASPIDQAREADIAVARLHAEAALAEAGIWTFNPAAAWRGPALHADDAPMVAKADMAALEECDGLLAIWPDGVVSVGVPIEIERAHRMGKPVAVVGGPRIAQSVFLGEMGIPVYVPSLEDDEAEEAVREAVGWLSESLGAGGPDGSAEDEESHGSAQDGYRTVLTTDGFVQVPVRVRVEPMLQFDTEEAVGAEVYLQAVRAEIERAAAKFPESDANTVEDWFSIWAEEAVEAFKAWNDHRRVDAGLPMVIDGAVQTTTITAEDLRVELVQAAAMGGRLWLALAQARPH